MKQCPLKRTLWRERNRHDDVCELGYAIGGGQDAWGLGRFHVQLTVFARHGLKGVEEILRVESGLEGLSDGAVTFSPL
ncbi:MAG: hypothetical protein OEV08_09535 [Nitrospira sp.]|nr:hypothetical protein [Nitrospira sp.]